jgi:hypothetical protein
MADTNTNPLLPLIRIVGKKTVESALGNFAVNTECLNTVGRAMYRDEEDETMKPWASLTPKERKVWTQRASQAILGLREYVLA